jgi:hypothetical protein
MHQNCYVSEIDCVAVVRTTGYQRKPTLLHAYLNIYYVRFNLRLSRANGPNRYKYCKCRIITNKCSRILHCLGTRYNLVSVLTRFAPRSYTFYNKLGHNCTLDFEISVTKYQISYYATPHPICLLTVHVVNPYKFNATLKLYVAIFHQRK